MDPFTASTSSTAMTSSSTSTGRNIFEEFEIEYSLKIPEELKNLLIFNGFDNALALSKMDGTDIMKVEQIARDHIPELIPAKDFHKYLGPFKSSPNKFFIMPGQKRLLNELINFADQTRSKIKRSRSFTDHENTEIKRLTPAGYYEFPNDTNKQSSPPPEQQPPSALNYLSATETENMHKLLENWIMNFCASNLQPEQTVRVSATLPRLKVHSPDGLQCVVTCCICPKEQKLYRSSHGTAWIMSNFHKHFKTHFVPGKRFSRNFISSYSYAPEESSGGSSVAEEELIDEKPLMRSFADPCFPP